MYLNIYLNIKNTLCILIRYFQFFNRSVVSSEISEEDLELLSKTINLSGFDDNISPCNHINLLLRFAIGEVNTVLFHTSTFYPVKKYVSLILIRNLVLCKSGRYDG